MGLFDRLFRRKKHVEPAINDYSFKKDEISSIQEEAEIKPARITPPTARHNMSLNKYEVKAVYIPTNRSRKRIMYGKNEADVRSQLSDYKEPDSIVEMAYDPPSQPQLDFARKLHIIVPTACCKEDMSALISEALRKEHEDLHDKPWRHVPPGYGLTKFADTMHIPYSRYAEEFIVIRTIYMFVKSKSERVAFMIACMHRHLKGAWDFSSWNKWLNDADELLQNDSFIRSFENNIGLEDGFCGFDYWETISKRTKLYQALVEKANFVGYTYR